jgi:site-specific DNA-methyltransferase (adenine-specific)
MNIERNNIYHGDCLEVMKYIPDNSVDMVLCDLPYEISFCKWDKMIDMNLLWKQYNRIVKENGAILLFGQQPFTSKLIMSNLENFKYQLIWKKEKPSNVFNVKYQFGRIHEDICVFYRKQPTYNAQMQQRKNVTNPKPMKGNLNIDTSKNISGVYKHSKDYDPTLVYPNSVLEFNRDSKKGNAAIHPTQKPVALLEHLIKTFTNENELVVDNTAGSCSTAIACLKTKRNWIMIEKEYEYYNLSLKRIQDYKLENNIQ